MNVNASLELRQYVAEQIKHYIAGQTTGSRVSSQQMKILETGVKNICSTAYPEHESILSTEVPRIIRTALEMKQLGLSGKIKRIIDSASVPKDLVISGMLNDIISAKSLPNNHPKAVKKSWIDQLKAKKVVQNINNER